MKLPQGFLFSGINCGIKKDKKLDLGLIYCEDFAKGIGFFTSNVNPSYSVIWSKKNINNPIKAILVNSGNANCFSHRSGIKDTQEIMKRLAEELKVKDKNVLFASTGIIGKILPKQKIIRAIPILIKNLKKNVKDFSTSILTTDTFEKVICKNFFINHDRVSILGIAKGAGMIYPNLATMLGFILTDIDLEESLFKKLAKGAIEESFNSISVDGCRSTNDTVFFLSSRKFILKEETHIKIFYKNLKEVCLELAKMIVRDAEGCSKFIQINVKGAKTKKEAKLAGFSIANSNLFKCAIYGEDPNWGRILSSLGQVGIKVRENFSIKFSSLKKKDILIEVNLKRGNFSWTVYTSDITPKYIELNSCYN